MREAGLGARYAQALFGAALGRGAVDEVAADLASFLELDESDASLRLFLESPQVRDDQKHAVVDTVLAKSTHPLTARFFHLVLDKKRAHYLRDMARAYAALVERHHHLTRARVTTAVPLTEDEYKRLAAALEKRTGGSVVLEPRTDPAVIGGVSVQLGDQVVDDTVSTRLAEIREALLSVGI
jgi:F-type H+-transporting ATPase subunit delta